jgi:hypothetical protein
MDGKRAGSWHRGATGGALMPELKQCEFFLLRYVPDAVKNEFVNIGVVLSSRDGATQFRMTRDWSRVRCVDPAADLEMLEAIETELRARLSQGDEARVAILKKLDDSFSNLLQISEIKPCLAEDPQAEIETLAKLYLQSERREKIVRDAGARTRIFNRMRSAFEHAGVWDDPRMWKKVPVGELAANGDPLKIDCGYRPNGIVRIFHAVSLETDINAAKVLAYSLPALQAAILEKEKAQTELTAIVEANLDNRDKQVAFALATLEHSSIKIAGIDKLPTLAERARKELNL